MVQAEEGHLPAVGTERALELGHLPHAGSAGGGEEVDDDRGALEIGERPLGAVEVGERLAGEITDRRQLFLGQLGRWVGRDCPVAPCRRFRRRRATRTPRRSRRWRPAPGRKAGRPRSVTGSGRGFHVGDGIAGGEARLIGAAAQGSGRHAAGNRPWSIRIPEGRRSGRWTPSGPGLVVVALARCLGGGWARDRADPVRRSAAAERRDAFEVNRNRNRGELVLGPRVLRGTAPTPLVRHDATVQEEWPPQTPHGSRRSSAPPGTGPGPDTRRRCAWRRRCPGAPR